jgi:hypothetical protein
VAGGKCVTSFGRLSIRATDAETAELSKDIALAAAEEPNATGRFVDVGGRRAYLKAGPLRGKSRIRHALRGLLLRRAPPRLNEFANLRWLLKRDFLAPSPLAAGVFYRTGSPCYQFLLTQAVPGGQPLDEYLFSATPAERAVLVERFGREIARLHRLGFVHRDLYLRNFFVCRRDGTALLYFLDAWRGGPRPNLRGPAYDIACLMLFGAELLTPEEQALFFRSYFGSESAPGNVARFLERVVSHRSQLVNTLARKPGRRRGFALPSREWRPKLHARPGRAARRTDVLQPAATAELARNAPKRSAFTPGVLARVPADS